jgi:DNA modification methylase
MRDLPTRAIDYRPVNSLTPARRNARTHSRKQIRQIATSIERFGFTNPVLVDDEGSIIAGHGRVAAAKLLGINQIPVVVLGDLTPKERQAYALADNKLALNAGWDQDLLALEFQELIDAGFEVELTGFSLTEVDFTLDLARQQQPGPDDSAANRIPDMPEHAVSRPGDLWCLANHLLLCGDARDPAHYDRLLQGGQVGLVFTDPPYNVPIDGHVCGLGRVRHREFAMGVGEMAAAEFSTFLTVALTNMAACCQDGAILYVCMDWRHLEELSAAGRLAELELKNLCVWNKTNGGMGSFYRSKHELVFVFKHGAAPHVNNFGLGDTGRYRTNVWDYPGISSIGGKRAEELAMHPTVKPVALVADAIRDCSRRGDLVLDPFAGSGTTLMAAQMTGRAARLIEYDPHYCDTIIRRFQAFTGKEAILADSREAFEGAAVARGLLPQEGQAA